MKIVLGNLIQSAIMEPTTGAVVRKVKKVVAIPHPRPADHPQSFHEVQNLVQGDLDPSALFADYRIVTTILADHLLCIPLTVTFANPFERVATIQQVSTFFHTNVSRSNPAYPLRDIYQEEGIEGFFVGNLVGLMQDSLFKLSDTLIGEVFNSNNFGGIYGLVASNIIARLIAYPLLTVRRRLQVMWREDRTIMGITRTITKKKGFLGIWDGVLLKIFADGLQLALQYGVMRLVLGHHPEYVVVRPKFDEFLSFGVGLCVASAVAVPIRTIVKINQISDEWLSIPQIWKRCGTRNIIFNGMLSTVFSSCFSVFGLFCSSQIIDSLFI